MGKWRMHEAPATNSSVISAKAAEKWLGPGPRPVELGANVETYSTVI